MRVFARVESDIWREVVEQSATGCNLLPGRYTFEQVWQQEIVNDSSAAVPEFYPWESLLFPLPLADVTCWAYALTYVSHRNEARLKQSLRCRKEGPALLSTVIPYRPYLDYEAELGLLVNRNQSDRFGFIMVNDLTDRSVQVYEHSWNKEKRIKAFSRAKSFAGSLVCGPLLGIGSEHDWSQLTVQLRHNGDLRQKVRAKDCLLSPGTVYRESFEDHLAGEWVLAATGTAEGVLFKAPSLYGTVSLLYASRLSLRKAKSHLLNSHRFLQPGDELELYSPTLGTARARVE